MRFSTVLLVPCVLVIAGCPSSSGTDAGSDAPTIDTPRVDGGETDGGGIDGGGIDGGGTDGGGTDGGSSGALGDCDDDGDCPTGGTCVELTPGGYRVCQVPYQEATTCETGRGDECCTTADCTTGECFLGPIRRFCGGAKRLPFNECAVDECAADTDCADDGVCAPRGTFGPVALCVIGACHDDAGCTEEAGGHCVVVTDPCCGIRLGLFCSYPSDGCQTDADCPSGYCGVMGDRATCMAGGPICPG